MTRVLRIVVHNWPLKVAAIGLATLLYGGLVLSQSSTTFSGGVIPVTVEGQPDDTFLLTAVPPVTEVRYLAAPDVPTPISASFIATIDLSEVTPGAGPQSVPIRVEAIDSRINVLGAEPAAVIVELDTLKEKTVEVVIERGTVPLGLEVGTTTIDPPTVVVSGPASIVDTVVVARGDVIIQASGIDVDQDVRLIAVDQVGAAVSPIQVSPATARVTIPVFSDRQSRTLPISATISGTPAAGFEIASVTLDPPVVTVEGDIDELAELVSIATEPVRVTGLSGPRTFQAELVLPTGVVALDTQTVAVSVTVRPVTSTRTFEVGLRLIGADPGLTYRIGTDRVLMTVGGSVADLDRIDGASLVGELRVTGLPVGTQVVPVTATLPGGVTLVGADPTLISVNISSTASPAPSGG
ncbi:MAG: YbbR-like domain-containing protein [Candidatus Limnocylindria bacterium]